MLLRLLYRLLLLWPHLDITKDVKVTCKVCHGGGFIHTGQCPECVGGYVGMQKVVYLRRWFIWRNKWLRTLVSWTGWKPNFGNIYLHEIMRSDDDPDPHDHPWDFTSIILRGGYRDEQWVWNGLMPQAQDRYARQYKGSEVVRPFTIVRRKAEHIHRVILNSVGDVVYENGQLVPRDNEIHSWSLVFAGPYRRHWNFITPRGYALWWEYIGIKKPANVENDDLGDES